LVDADFVTLYPSNAGMKNEVVKIVKWSDDVISGPCLLQTDKIFVQTLDRKRPDGTFSTSTIAVILLAVLFVVRWKGSKAKSALTLA
jgi:hypothetical protein